MRQPTCHPRAEPLAEPNLDYRTLKKAVLENRRFLVVVVHQSDQGTGIAPWKEKLPQCSGVRQADLGGAVGKLLTAAAGREPRIRCWQEMAVEDIKCI